MKIIFLSTELTPHQIPFCDCLHRLADQFCFIQYAHRKETWVSKGQQIQAKDYAYLRFYHREKACCDELLFSADVVIVGGVDLSVVERRMRAGKLVFVYLERFYKEGIKLKNLLRAVGGTWLHHGKYQKYRPYLLCASGYCAGDAAVFNNYKRRMLKWGYFPETKSWDVADLFANKQKNTIIWVGRLLDWKHPDDMLQAARRLKARGIPFDLKVYGDGPMKKDLERLVEQLDLADRVALCGNVSNETICREMERASIFVATSDYREGWGCVVNEAMNNGCATVVSHAAGAAPFLINDGQNGLVYESGNVEELTELCAELLGSAQLCRRLGENAYKTLSVEWNAQTAAERLLAVSANILQAQDRGFAESGPCSYAEPIKQKSMYARIKNDTCKQNGTGGNTAVSQ